MQLNGSQTERNLVMAFAGESLARNRYTYFATKAKKENLEQIASIFLDTAENEKEHAKRFFNFLKGGSVDIVASFPAGVVGDTAANLDEASQGEHPEWSEMCPQFGKIADEESFADIASAF